jgi:transcription elongation factor Elf1
MMEITVPSATRTLLRCLVCGSSEVHTEEVVDRGVILLAQCRRCDRRWTGPAEAAPMPERMRARLVRCATREVAGAA